MPSILCRSLSYVLYFYYSFNKHSLEANRALGMWQWALATQPPILPPVSPHRHPGQQCCPHRTDDETAARGDEAARGRPASTWRRSPACAPPPALHDLSTPKAPGTLLQNCGSQGTLWAVPLQFGGGMTMTERESPVSPPQMLRPHGTQPDSQPSCSGRALLCVLLWACGSRGAVFHSFLGHLLRVENPLYV